MVSSEAWAKLRDWASVAGKGRLLLSGSAVLASLKASVRELGYPDNQLCMSYLKPSLKVQTVAGDLPVLRSDREPAIKIGNDVESQVSQNGREI